MKEVKFEPDFNYNKQKSVETFDDGTENKNQKMSKKSIIANLKTSSSLLKKNLKKSDEKNKISSNNNINNDNSDRGKNP